ncbi:MAG: hypothetical protein LBH42_07090 [Treponema sp.]|jgi:hypothetical protein|nr:hypothetical protein [Treponema sp.]
MKRIFLIAVILLVIGTAVYAQAVNPTSSQTKQSAQQLSTQSKTNSSQFDSALNELRARFTGNNDFETYTKLKYEIERIEKLINAEESRLKGILDGGRRVDSQLLDNIQRLIHQHKTKIAELDAFIAG